MIFKMKLYNKNIFNLMLLPIKNNPLLLIISVIFLLLLLGNKVYHYYNYDYKDVARLQSFFPEISKAEKQAFQKRVIKESKRFKDARLYIHIIRQGENYWQVARENGITIDTVIGLNPYLKNLYAGLDEHIIVGNRNGVIHTVGKNENLVDISRLYRVSVAKIREENSITLLKELLYGVKKGDILFIPEAKPEILTKDMNKWYNLRRALQSPLGGAYTSGYGIRHDPITGERKFHNGIDIRAPIGTSVGASADGVVIATGWAGGYGLMVKIKHYNGYTTLYGHLSRIYVRTGQKVRRGQIIARSGNTGRTTGPHLHFTVWYKGTAVNPALFLW